MIRNGDGEERLWHIVGGRPEGDDDCPICRAHGIDVGGLPDDVPMSFIQPLELDALLRCDCPLCQEVRRSERFEG